MSLLTRAQQALYKGEYGRFNDDLSDKEKYELYVDSHKDLRRIFTEHAKWLEKKNKKYWYMVTFTISPKLSQAGIRRARSIVERLHLRQESLNLVYLAYVEEKCKSGKPHWHVAMCATTCIKKNRFNSYIDKYGFVDVRKQRKKDICETEMLRYMSKENLPMVMLDTLKRKVIEN